MSRIMLLDGQYQHTLAIAGELSRDLEADIIGVAPSSRSHLHRSRHVRQTVFAPLAIEDDYVETIVRLAHEHSPDAIVPVGYYSFSKLIAAADQLPDGTALVAPSAGAFAVAESKYASYELARSVGVDAPADYTDALLDSSARESLTFPVFAKAKLERGGQSTAFVADAHALANLDVAGLGGDILLQEYIDSDPYTYAYSGFFVDGEAVVTHQHIELRSVPRHGGSGTRLRTIDESDVREQGQALLRDLRWTGVAQVEFKRRRDGQLVLMEINPKFWASYALASRSGARVASAAVQHFLGSAPTSRTTASRLRPDLEMVFPTREALYVLTHRREENLMKSLGAMLWPPATWDLELLDLYAHIPMRGQRHRAES